jgi:hypothetical protein
MSDIYNWQTVITDRERSLWEQLDVPRGLQAAPDALSTFSGSVCQGEAVGGIGQPHEVSMCIWLVDTSPQHKEQHEKEEINSKSRINHRRIVKKTNIYLFISIVRAVSVSRFVFSVQLSTNASIVLESVSRKPHFRCYDHCKGWGSSSLYYESEVRKVTVNLKSETVFYCRFLS